MTHQELHGFMTNVSKKIREKHMSVAEHCAEHVENIASVLTLRRPIPERTQRGTKILIYNNSTLANTKFESTSELLTSIMNRSEKRNIIETVQADT